MSVIKFEIDEGRTHFFPGETITGRGAWHFDAKPDVVEVRLLWYTEGKGTRDTHVEESVVLESDQTWGDAPFSLSVPDGPYSFSGKLVTLIWAVEIVAEPSNESYAQDITIGIYDGEIQLHAPEGEA